MINLLLGLAALMAGGAGLVLYVAARAPLGYEDEKGFHLGNKAVEPPREMPRSGRRVEPVAVAQRAKEFVFSNEDNMVRPRGL